MAEKDRKSDSFVVGIGASAGGLEALRAYFSRMPREPGFACVVVVHLSPEHESHLVEMLQPYTQMPVCQVVKTTLLEPNRVYVIPPNANLNTIDTHLRLSELEVRRTQRAPIDHFLRTLAETHGDTAVGVILSGAGSDGALGIRQIKENGGLAVAQDPSEAEYASMPQSAIDTGTVDLVLPVRDMAEEIRAYCATRPVAVVAGDDEVLGEEEASLLEKILGEVRLRTGQEFAMYRPGRLLQRVRRRMRLRHVSSLEAYFEVLRTHPEEPRALYDDLLLNVTEFFRDPESYRTIEAVLSEILERKADADGRVRLWSIGCSTGEEAYSLAMLLIEQTAARGEDAFLQVFASELSPNVLGQARDGVYPQEIAATISPERLERFFVHETGRYRVRRELRSVVTFATHDLFKDPPYAHLDMIICRNLLRDLQPQMRRGVLSLFYYALEPHGVLLIDPNDQVEVQGLFTRDSASPQLLRRVTGPRQALGLPAGVRPFARMSGERGGAPIVPESFDTSSLFRRAVERYTPPSVLVDSHNHVVHFSSSAARYVRIPGGELTLDVLKLVPGTIRSRLLQGLRVVRAEQRSWHSEPFATVSNGHMRRIALRIDPVHPGRVCELLLVVFDDNVEPAEPSKRAGPQTLDQVLKLQTELQAAQEHVTEVTRVARRQAKERSTLSAAHDQLLRTVEELECAREDLQALNEELVAINDENSHRIEALAEVSNDLHHLLESTGLATVQIDRSFNVVRFTPLAAELLRLKDQDIGRALGELDHQLRYPALLDDMRRVLEDSTVVEAEVESEDGRWFLLRSLPYRTAMRGVEGVALIFVDITARKRAELALRESDRRKDEFLAVLAHELRNPLAPIGAGIELLRKIPDDSALVQRVAATMARQSRQLVRLVDDLLEVGRISEGKLTLRTEPLAIADVVRDAIAAVRPFIEGMEHELTVEVPPEPLIVEGDAARLVQVIGNVLHNAARYTPPKGHIALRVQHSGPQVVISVQDDGSGIDPQMLPNVFEMFYQVPGASGGVNNAGLGIGLTLAKRLVEMHAGTISAESAGTNMGSTFTVRLPLAQTAGAGTAAERPDRIEGVVDQHRVLIVDDNADAAETLRLLMQALGGGDVQTASNGTEALAIGAKLRPDLVLLDLGMPGMDGYELARRMRAESWGKQARLVALTGWGQEQFRRRSKEAGFDRHMTKPADTEALRAVLNGS